MLIREVILKVLAGSVYFPSPTAFPFGKPKPSPDAPDEWDGQGSLALAIVMMVIGVAATLGRLWLRATRKTSNLGIDDLFAVLSMVGYSLDVPFDDSLELTLT